MDILNGNGLYVRLVTNMRRDELRIPRDRSSFFLSVTYGRYILSEIVNNLLGLEEPQPFDSLINGEILRTTLLEFCVTRAINAEITLELEYVPLVFTLSALERQPLVHDEWVSAVSGLDSRFVATGSHANLGRIWNAAGECVFLLQGHMDAITSIAPIPTPGSEQLQLVTASKDRSLRFWQVALNEGTSTTSTLKALKRLKGHTVSVMCVAASPSGSQVCSGSGDKTIKLWNLGDEPEAEEDLGGEKKLSETGAVEATVTLQGHTHTIGGLDWAEHDTIYSASKDHSVRAWDVETAVNTQTLVAFVDEFLVLKRRLQVAYVSDRMSTCREALYCVSVGGGRAFPAVGGADHVLTMWDPREIVVPAFELSSHTGQITACKWNLKSIFNILTASHDGMVKLWDTRMRRDLITWSHKEKVLCADWWTNEGIVSGGEDSKLSVYMGGEDSKLGANCKLSFFF